MPGFAIATLGYLAVVSVPLVWSSLPFFSDSTQSVLSDVNGDYFVDPTFTGSTAIGFSHSMHFLGLSGSTTIHGDGSFLLSDSTLDYSDSYTTLFFFFSFNFISSITFSMSRI